MINTEVIVAIIGFFGTLITAGVVLVDRRLNKQVQRVQENKEVALSTQAENDILDKIVPILESRDEHLEAMVDIMEGVEKRLHAIEVQNQQFQPLLYNRCPFEKMLQRMGIEGVRTREELIAFLDRHEN